MHSKAYSGRNVNQIDLGKLLNGRDGQRVWAGADIGKYEVQLVLNWGQSDFERPWKIGNPQDIGVTVELLKRLSQERELILALEPSGTYGDVLRQQCSDGGIVVHRVHPKVSHDYAEVFDGVPSQHDGKDAAVVAELARLGKSAPWPWIREPEELQQIAYWVEELDIQRRLEQMWLGRLEAIMARYWPELPRQMRLSRKTLLKAVAHYGGPAALAQDEKAAEHLKGWGGNRLSDAAVKQIIEGARHTRGVGQQPLDQKRLRHYAEQALAIKVLRKEAETQLSTWSKNHKTIRAMGAAVGVATACVLFTELGDPHDYHCAAAYVKAMGLNLAERSSGTYKGRLRISKRGSGITRYWMYLAACRQTKNSSVRSWYLRKKIRDSKKGGKALVAIMRRLGAALYHVARGDTFDAARLFPGKRTKVSVKGAMHEMNV